MHVGRAWEDTEIEDGCLCEKAICGLVVLGKFHPDCEWHDMTRTIRQGHRGDQCPGYRESIMSEDWF